MKILDPVHLFSLGHTVDDVQVDTAYFDDFYVTLRTLTCKIYRFYWDELERSWMALIAFPNDLDERSAWPRKVNLHQKGLFKKYFAVVLTSEETEDAGPR